MMGYFGGWNGMGWFGFSGMFLFFFVIVLLTAWALRATGPAPRQVEGDAALNVLRRRFAAGEITDAEYQQARRVLARDQLSNTA